ncbi:ABC transporter, ATP-binding protein [Marvinbryantia formatexigens DSM 14469]|uniref:ABC transporter, ATP-binding protein n=1 Tax=Marvinbryantia formatexigens DSM 14469 TaxID=478749 RepID=C6LJ38_9FIRM|nr:ABC transporter ATP-binding protein [Marvinbryantia formatexigens]EET59358.1 ABC transporter, ATP-binding protein [Marvinbryantia formatexigens DSM 14469]UWO24377.1 ABC transporter ATP-binding protein/permease [Marvinbryantia formatexigens DSM 14469]SDF51490.1 ATP-binding cassette, subfamily B [Marvinbryantia formatexigens]
MSAFREWFETMTLGQTKKYMELLAWSLFDSFVVSIPYAVMIMAMYVLLIPVLSPETKLPLNRMGILTGILLAQFIGYLFIRRKSYLDFCTGFAGTTRTSRIQMGEHLRSLSMGFFASRDAGDLSTVLLRDYTEIENFAQQLLPQVATILIRFLLAVVVLSAFDVRMTAAVFLVIPLALPFAFLSLKRMEKESRRLQTSQQEVAAGILEYVGGIQTLKAFHMAGERFETLKASVAGWQHASIRLETGAAAPVSMVGRCLLNCGIGVVMLTGGFLLTKGELSPFYYMAFMLLSLTIYDPVLMLFTFIADFSRTARSGGRIRSLFEEKPLPEAKEGAAPEKYDIVFKDVSFAYGREEVLHRINLTFPERSVTALVGPSGSGKSTITRLIARFWDVTEGEIRMGGIPIRNIPSQTLLGNISVVFQDVYLFHDTIEENIRMGREDATHEEIVAAAKKAACHDFIMALHRGYQTMVGEGGSTLSGGEKQRISIARALLKDAPVVLLDEATSSLDPENEVLIQQAISALVEEKTVIVIAHRLQSISNADKIVVLEEGAVSACGTHEELLREPGIYSQLWQEQQNAGSWQIKA